jgi:hypothetical protein
MRVEHLIAAGVILGAMAVAPVAKANSIVLNQNAYSFADGGEFTAMVSPQNFLGGYVPTTILNGGFETFCVQASVTFAPGSTYSFTLGSSDSQGRALTQGAAFLYYQFAKGLLTGYDYFNSANRRIDSGELQAAIWKLQGNQSGGSSFPNAGTGNPFYDLAVSTLGINNITTANDGLYDVGVLQLWDRSGNARQNQLVVGLADGGSTLAMMATGLAAVCVAGVRTRRLQPAPVRSR